MHVCKSHLETCISGQKPTHLTGLAAYQQTSKIQLLVHGHVRAMSLELLATGLLMHPMDAKVQSRGLRLLPLPEPNLLGLPDPGAAHLPAALRVPTPRRCLTCKSNVRDAQSSNLKYRALKAAPTAAFSTLSGNSKPETFFFPLDPKALLARHLILSKDLRTCADGLLFILVAPFCLVPC